MKYSRIIGVGSYLPEKILSNADLEKMVNTSDQWITERTGIKNRHIIAKDELDSDMAVHAAKKALQYAAMNAREIDLIIVATITGEFLAPSTSCILQHKLGIKGCPAFDVNAGCSGFIYGLNIADQFIKNGTAKNILLVACEALSKVTDWNDRSTCVLFGDGAGAAVIKADSKPGIRDINVHADGSIYDLLVIPSGLYDFIGSPYIKMKGNELFRVAVNRLSEIVRQTVSENNLKIDDIDWLVPHQANLRIIKATAKKINLPMEKIILTISEHGNTSAASLALALDEGVRSGKIKSGDTVLLEAFGAGITWGSVLFDF